MPRPRSSRRSVALIVIVVAPGCQVHRSGAIGPAPSHDPHPTQGIGQEADDTGPVSIDLNDPSDEVLAFLAERHLATLTTLRRDSSPHVAPVGFTYEPGAKVARIITFRPARRVANIGTGARVAVCQVDGARWLTLEGHATVTDDATRVAEAVRRYAERYRQPGDRDNRVAIEITVDRIMGRA